VKLLKDMQETVETKEAVVLELLQRGKVQDDDFALLIKELKKSNGGVSCIIIYTRGLRSCVGLT
jgi:hypothetical protein